MGKQIKKKTEKKRQEPVCEQCGNPVPRMRREFRCKYCGWRNNAGLDKYDVKITSGGLER